MKVTVELVGGVAAGKSYRELSDLGGLWPPPAELLNSRTPGGRYVRTAIRGMPPDWCSCVYTWVADCACSGCDGDGSMMAYMTKRACAERGGYMELVDGVPAYFTLQGHECEQKTIGGACPICKDTPDKLRRAVDLVQAAAGRRGVIVIPYVLGNLLRLPYMTMHDVATRMMHLDGVTGVQLDRTVTEVTSRDPPSNEG